ncbi:MAG: hypothetical protein COA43_07090 [Robiginitomaculum sp.]|nr:MAG: hypothetical protein COA43_07090 [Robiginitomaculum sp.]
MIALALATNVYNARQRRVPHPTVQPLMVQHLGVQHLGVQHLGAHHLEAHQHIDRHMAHHLLAIATAQPIAGNRDVTARAIIDVTTVVIDVKTVAIDGVTVATDVNPPTEPTEIIDTITIDILIGILAIIIAIRIIVISILALTTVIIVATTDAIQAIIRITVLGLALISSSATRVIQAIAGQRPHIVFTAQGNGHIAITARTHSANGLLSRGTIKVMPR